MPVCTPRAAIGAAISTTACVTTKQNLVCAKAILDVDTALHDPCSREWTGYAVDSVKGSVSKRSSGGGCQLI